MIADPLDRARHVTTQFAFGRFLEALIGIALAWLLMGSLDAGRFRDQPIMAVVAFGIAFTGGIVGVVGVARLVRFGLGMEDLRWFPSGAEIRGLRGTLALLAVGLAVAGVTLLAYVWWPGVAWRVALAAGGAFVGFLAFVRPRGFWNAPSVTALREVVGDAGTTVLYGIVAVICLAAAFVV